MNTPTLKAQILERIMGNPARTVWTATDFAAFGTRNAIDKALERLAAAAELRRVERGLYDRPTYNKLTKKSSPPDPRGVIDAIARRDQIRVLVDGMTAANDLGLTNAVPAKIVVHTDARLKPIRLGNQEITFRPTAPSKLYWAGRPAMRIVQALHWLRDTTDRPEELQAIRSRLRNLLCDNPQAEELRADLGAGLSSLPAWMQDLLKPLLNDQISGDE